MKQIMRLMLLTSIIVASPVRAQDIADLWEYGILNPEQFDNYVDQNRPALQQRFNGCLQNLINRYFQQAQVEVQQCHNVAGYGKAYVDCINNTPASSVVVSSQTLYSVINGQMLWRNTMYAESALIMRQMAPMLGMDFPGLVRMFTNISRQYMRCP